MSAISTNTRPSLEDEFYINLTLGLLKVLNNIPRVMSVILHKQQPCERSQVTAWEQRHNVYLPDDMKRFYLSTDGFVLYWNYHYSHNYIRRVGCISIPHLLQITLLRDYLEVISQNTVPVKTSATTATTTIKRSPVDPGDMEPFLNSRSKIFEISNICDVAKVCLVYESLESINPKIYLLEVSANRWQYLADSFTEYHRMCIAHLGLPYWELCFAATCKLPSWAEQLFLIIAPHLLERNEMQRCRILPAIIDHPSYNQLDVSVFRSKNKCVRQTPRFK